MAAEHEGGDVFDRDVELAREKIAEARAVEHASHADNLVLGQAGYPLQRPDHGIERVGNTNNEGIGRIFLDTGADLLHHLQIRLEKVVAAHPRLARDAGGYDHDICALEVGIVIDPEIAGIETFDWRGLRDVERLALGQALHDVEHHDIAEFLESDQMGKSAADHA